jgi:ketosteroid isomerase-like protein
MNTSFSRCRTALAAASVFVLALLAGCAAAPRAPGEADFRRMVAESYVAPFKAADYPRWLEVFADDAVALHNRRPADVGKSAIKDFAAAVEANFRLARFDVAVSDVRIDGNVAWTRGEYTSEFVSKASGTSPWGVENGKFLLIWQRQADGSWKIVLDMGNSNGTRP